MSDPKAHHPPGSRPSRDDTPSFIQNLQAQADLFNRERPTTIPVLEMPLRVRVWRKIRLPLLIAIAIVVLVVVGVATHRMLVARQIRNTIAEARDAESRGTLEDLLVAYETTVLMAERRPDRAVMQVEAAWHLLMLHELTGAPQDSRARAERLLARAASEVGADAVAAQAMLAHVQGDGGRALTLTRAALAQDPKPSRLRFVEASALLARGQTAAALKAIATGRQAAPEYLPLLGLELRVAVGVRDRKRASELATAALEKAPRDVYAKLVSIALSLPYWGEEEPSAETSATAIAVLEQPDFLPRKNKLPPRLLGYYKSILGRAKLLAGAAPEALPLLAEAVSLAHDAETVAWWGEAVMQVQGARAALTALEGDPSRDEPQVLDVRGRALIALGRTAAAEAVVAQLAKHPLFAGGVTRLRFALAVQRGDLAQAMPLLPTTFSGSDEWLAVELFELARFAGDAEALKGLTDRLEASRPFCAKAMRAWRGGDPAKALAALTEESSETCHALLAARLLRRFVAPSTLLATAARALAHSRHLEARIDHALAVWVVEGRDKALGLLSEVAQIQPDAPSLRLRLVAAFIEVGAAAPALTALEGFDHPEALPLRIAALRLAGREAECAPLIEAALDQAKASGQPATWSVALEGLMAGNGYDQVVTLGEEIQPRAGRYAAEIGELIARARNATGDRGEADRGLTRLAYGLRRSVGLDEGLEAELALIRINLRRGGDFLNKAFAVAWNLRNEKIAHPEILLSLAIGNERQSNERGAVKLLVEAVELDPSFSAGYRELAVLKSLDGRAAALMKLARPELKL